MLIVRIRLRSFSLILNKHINAMLSLFEVFDPVFISEPCHILDNTALQVIQIVFHNKIYRLYFITLIVIASDLFVFSRHFFSFLIVTTHSFLNSTNRTPVNAYVSCNILLHEALIQQNAYLFILR